MMGQSDAMTVTCWQGGESEDTSISEKFNALMRHASDSKNNGSGDGRRGRGIRQPERMRERRSPAGRDQDPVIGEAYLEAQFGNQQQENADLQRQLKRAEAKETTFKYKGHELQYKFNASLGAPEGLRALV
jgi:hypothetical protein